MTTNTKATNPTQTITADAFFRLLQAEIKRQSAELGGTLKFKDGTSASEIFSAQHNYSRRSAELQQAATAIETAKRGLGSLLFATIEVAK